MILQLPKRVESNFEGYQSLISLLKNTSSTIFEDVVIDFSETVWFEANLCAVLAACINTVEDSLNNVSIDNLPQSIHTIFSKNHFLSYYGGQMVIDFHETAIKFKKYKVSEEKRIKEQLDKELLEKGDFPKLSSLLKKKIGESIFEIFINASMHGGASHVYSCGQYYPNKNPKRIDFTIVDLGRTIKANVASFLNKNVNGQEAIEWAVQKGNTTKTGTIPGGLGLKLIQDFMELNKGKIQIVSADGFWEFSNQEVRARSFGHEFPGTIVNLEFNLDDNSYYQLKSEQTSDKIF